MDDLAHHTLAIDFGTSNSAAAILDAGHVRRLQLEDGADTLPTAVFFPMGGAMQIGTRAGAALIAGDEGRYMRALKSVLGTPLFHEERRIGGRRQTLLDVVAAFLGEVKARAEAQTGRRFSAVVSGRPVHFHPDPARDAAALRDLDACYRAAGFEHLRFMREPEAAALASHGTDMAGGLGLVVDIGGGTSDFTLYRSTRAGPEILASHGLRLGGTDFDRLLSLTHVMGLLGQGGEVRREFGPGLLPMPGAIYGDLATWARIPFLYTGETRRYVADLLKRAVERRKVARLGTVLEHELGHDIAFAVEAGKIAANRGEAAQIALDMIEPGLAAALDEGAMTQTLAASGAAIGEAMRETLRLGGVQSDALARIVLVGGSSLMGLVSAAARQVCPEADIARADAFTAVADGLALAIGQPDPGRQG